MDTVLGSLADRDDNSESKVRKPAVDDLTILRSDAAQDAPVAAQLHDVVAAKLEVTLQLRRDSPHAAELLDESALLSGELVEGFKEALLNLAAGTILAAESRGEVDLRGAEATEVADIALALVSGLEVAIADPDRARRQLRLANDLLTAGIAAPRQL